MKAIAYHRYGSPDVLEYEETEKPSPRDDEVLIRVRAAAINPVDRLFRGSSYIARILTGLRKPKDPRLGRDVAGEVEAVGRNVTQLKPGDEVFGVCQGAFAEYVCSSELVAKPLNVTFEQAAAVPVAALTALQGLRDKGKIQPGQKVLINGASGGVGTFAVQIARSFGAEVTGVGAHRVNDYTREDFTKDTQRYDVILDRISNHALSACRRVLNPNGVCAIAGGPSKVWIILILALKARVLSRFVSQNFVLFISRLRRYTLNEVPQAMRYLEEGHARGKVVITRA